MNITFVILFLTIFILSLVIYKLFKKNFLFWRYDNRYPLIPSEGMLYFPEGLIFTGILFIIGSLLYYLTYIPIIIGLINISVGIGLAVIYQKKYRIKKRK